MPSIIGTRIGLARSSSFAIQVVLQGLQTSFVVGEAISLARQTWVTTSDSVLPMWRIHSGSSSSSVTGNTVFSQSLNKCSPCPWAEGGSPQKRHKRAIVRLLFR